MIGEHLQHKTYTAREETVLEHAVEANWSQGEGLLSLLPRTEGEKETYLPQLKDAIFCGHLVTDLDSIAGAIGAAHLYGGVPARASDINTETQFALDTWKCCLLYTSPSPRDRQKSRMPSSA